MKTSSATQKDNRLYDSQSLSGFDVNSLARELQTEADPKFPEKEKSDISSPRPEAVIELVEKTRSLLFPGYGDNKDSHPDKQEKGLAFEIQTLYNNLVEQIIFSFHHDCNPLDRPCTFCLDRGHKKAAKFLQGLPITKNLLLKDVQAAFEGDPAAKSYPEIIICYPGFFAVTVYRMAHTLHELGIPLLPRMMSEYAHSRTGIDIHPGAEMGEYFCIDHGTGVVIGETTTIGDRVRIYQGVTLGALSLPRNAGPLYRNQKRHPTIEDDVIIYANATILGGETVIGKKSIIGGNVWITESVPPDTKVILKKPDLLYLMDS